MNNDASWAEEEFGEANLGDVRRTARLVQLATMLGAQPSASLPAMPIRTNILGKEMPLRSGL